MGFCIYSLNFNDNAKLIHNAPSLHHCRCSNIISYKCNKKLGIFNVSRDTKLIKSTETKRDYLPPEVMLVHI